jgi:CRP-like cAMP-binding protein
MEDNRLHKAINLLQKQYLFQGLDENQLASLVNRFEWIWVEADTIIFAEGEVGDNFYLIIDGRTRVTKQYPSGEKSLGMLHPGDYFGEEALLFDRPRSASVSALDRSLILRLGREQFFEILDAFPEVRLNLSATAESRYLARKQNFDWLNKDEVIYLITRKHEVFLILSLILPLLLGIGCIPVLSYSFVAASPLLASVSLYGGVIGLILMLAWAVWNWLDWGNDYYVVTSQRVVWQEKVIALYNSRREAPLTTVLSVNIISSFWGRILNYGNVDVRTFTGSILMKNMAHPYQFEAFIKNYRERAQQQLRLEEAKAMEAAIHERLIQTYEHLQIGLWIGLPRRNIPLKKEKTCESKWRTCFPFDSRMEESLRIENIGSFY